MGVCCRTGGKRSDKSCAQEPCLLRVHLLQVETWWVAETAKEARKAEQAEARVAAKAAKAAEKAAAKAQVGLLGGGKECGGGSRRSSKAQHSARGPKRGAAPHFSDPAITPVLLMQADAAAAEAAAKAPLPAPSLQEDLTLPGASTPAPAAAPVLSILQASWLCHSQLGAAGAQAQHSTAHHQLAGQAHIGFIPLCL